MFLFDKKKKKIAKISILALGLLAVSGGLLYVALQDSSLLQVVENTTSQTRYVLVNEDDGQDFEGTAYNLGNDFVTFISQDTKSQWETASKSTAEIGLENGQYDAMIIIPKDFSKNVLSLQSISPEKANIEYKIRDGQTQVTNQVIQKNVNAVLYDFNKRIVQMYFSSIVGSLVDAQDTLNSMMDTQTQLQNVLSTRIQTPFQALPQSFGSVSGLATSLESDVDRVEQQQQNFLNSMNAARTSQSQDSTTSSDSSNSSATNSSSTTGDLGFLPLFRTQLAALGGEGVDATGTEQSIYTRFLNQSSLFEENSSKREEQLKSQIKTIQAQVTGLEELQQKIASNYYGDSTKTPETATAQDSKLALASLMNSGKDSKLATDYLATIDTTVQGIPVTGLESLVNTLLSKNLITSDQASRYKSEISLVRKYSGDRGIATGSGTSYNLLDSSTSTSSNSVTLTSTLKVSTAGDTLTLSGTGITLANAASVANQIQTSLNSQLAPYNRTAVATSSGNTITVQVSQTSGSTVSATSQRTTSSQSTAVLLTNTTTDTSDASESTESNSDASQEQSSSSATSSSSNTAASDETQTESSSSDDNKDESNKQTLPADMAVTVSVQLTLPATSSKEGYTETEYQWSNNSGVIGTGKLASVDETVGDLTKDLPTILANFNSLDQASQQITTIFSNPDETVVTFAGRVVGSGLPITQLASANSVYYRYNNTELKTLAQNISDGFAESYKKDGDSLYQSLASQISDLKAFLGSESSDPTEDSLYGQLNALTDKGEYQNTLKELSNWYTTVSALLDAYYPSASGSTTSNSGRSSTDQANLDRVSQQLENLQNSAQDISSNSNSVATSATNDNSAIRNFSTTTRQLQSDADSLLGSLNQYASATGDNLSSNRNYAEAFSRVMSNTQNGGADNLRVFDFLASPMDITAIQGSTVRLSVVPYYMTLVGALTIILVSYFLVNLMKPRKIEVTDKLKRPTRIWFNTPNVVRINVVAGLAALAYAVATWMMVRELATVPWLTYSFLFIYGFILLFVYLLRKVKRTATLYVFAFLLGFYLMLTPIIGASTKIGSTLAWMYRLSPFQNIENGYTALLNGASIGWTSFLVLVVLAVITLGLNWLMKDNKETDLIG